jgi:hypothetical protein
MRTIVSLAVVLLGCAASLAAQINATLSRLPDGAIEVRVRNDSAIGATAFAIKVDHASGSAVADTRRVVYLDQDTVYVDTAIDIALRALQPKQQQTYRPQLRSHMGGPTALPQVLSGERKQTLMQVDLSKHTVTTAGVFADGTTSGDTGLVTRLMLRRSNMLLAVDLTLEMISDAGRRNVPRDQLIGQFKKLADSVRRGYLLPEQRVGLDLYQSMIGKLINLPELKDGAPFPPSNFVEPETALLRKQRVALVESQPSLFSVAGSSK